MNREKYDVVVIGAGVVGAAIARDLAGTSKRVALIDSNTDVCGGTSKANTAILHTGYDAKPGTLEARLVARGYHLTREYCAQTGISVERTGAILVAWDEEQAESLVGLQQKAVENGYTDSYLMSAAEVYEELPDIGQGATGGLAVPDESIIDPWTVPLAFATQAVERGAELILECQVHGVEVGGARADGAETAGAEKHGAETILRTSRGDIRAGWVINAAGLGGDHIDAMFGYDRLKITPRRGELLVYDKLTSHLAPKIVLAAPSKVGKGVLISPTIFGNTMLGPTADDIEDRTDTGTSEVGFEFLLEKGKKIMPKLLGHEVTAAYAGLRAAHNQPDYLIETDGAQRYCIAGAIRSTGLTSALAVAEYVRELLEEEGLDLTLREDLPEPPRMPALGEYGVRPYLDGELIARDPDFGTVVCFCERVTKGEIIAAAGSTIPPATLEGVRRRTRAMNGRCQGFFCGAHVKEIFEAHTGKAAR
ncbi:FAD-dependent oxidoreductase [Actinomycetaceae bacterium L2_0104]